MTNRREIELLGICIIMLIASACSGSSEYVDIGKYESWINSEEGGFIRQKEVGGINMQARYIPADYLAWQEIKEKRIVEEDSFKVAYAKIKDLKKFVFTMSAKDSREKILSRGITSNEAYQERIYCMNFRMEDNFSLTYDTLTIYPLHVAFENAEAFSGEIRFAVVFEDTIAASENSDIMFSYMDEYWGLGKVNFTFKKEKTSKYKLKIK